LKVSETVAANGTVKVPRADEGPRYLHIRLARFLLPPVVMFLVALWGISGASFWRDEAATLSAIGRPLPGLWHFLARTDVVHGFYYLMMFPIARLLGTSEFDVRLPSAVAAAVAASGVAAIAARLVSERAGITAGLMFTVFPVVSRYGQEARSYALVMALAVLLTYVLCRAIGPAGSRKLWLILYSVVLVVMGWMNLMSLLIIPAHGLTLVLAKRQSPKGEPQRQKLLISQPLIVSWLVSAIVAVLGVVPLLVLTWPQRQGTARFLSITSISAVADEPGRLTGSWEILPLVVVFAVVALIWSTSGSTVSWLCLPWLFIPTTVLLIAGTFSPLYDPRYTLFCVPALAILAGVGLDAAIKKVADRYASLRAESPEAKRHRILRTIASYPVVAALACVVLVGAIGLPSQLAYRSPDGHGDNIRLAASIVASNEQKGDTVLYMPPWWRQIAAAYPYGFVDLRDISLEKTPNQEGNFTGVQFSANEIRERLQGVRRVWLVEFLTFQPDPALGSAWKVIARWHPGTLVLTLYGRR
jgi:mannosyltransferase